MNTSWSPSRYRRSEEHTSELQSHHDLVCRLLLEKKKGPTHPRHWTRRWPPSTRSSPATSPTPTSPPHPDVSSQSAARRQASLPSFFFFLMIRHPPTPTLFPYTTLFR